MFITGKMAQQIKKLATKPDIPSLILHTVEGENQLSQVVLRPPYALVNTHTHSFFQKINNIIFKSSS